MYIFKLIDIHIMCIVYNDSENKIEILRILFKKASENEN